MPTAKMRVYLTVDVECAEERLVRGRVQAPVGYDVQMWGRFDNQREELGIGLIMRLLEAEGHVATFFVETVGAKHFGMAGLREVCTTLRRRGHDVQLHMHPVLERATFRSRSEPPVPDDIAAYAVDEQAAMLADGIQVLVDAGVHREDIRGFRAGNFGANNDTWLAMQRAGLAVSSNYDAGYFDGGCQIRWDGAETGLFATPHDGVWELPISCVREASGRLRHLQITAMSLSEMKAALWESRALGIGEVTIVTHSFEFYFADSITSRRGHPNLVNIARLRGLCRFLRKHDRDFEVDTVLALANRGPETQVRGAPASVRYPRGSRARRYRRLLEQGAKRVLARLPFG